MGWELDDWLNNPVADTGDMFGPPDQSAYDRTRAVIDGAAVGGTFGNAVGTASNIPGGSVFGAANGGLIGGYVGGWLYDNITTGDGSAVLDGGYNPAGDYTNVPYGGGG